MKPGRLSSFRRSPAGRQTGVFTAYLDNEKQYEYVWRGGVYHTGDAASMDENGRYWFRGRFDDIIKTGGYRVGPYEVENVLLEHPAVAECSVIGVPDPYKIQKVKAFVKLAADVQPCQETKDTLLAYCTKHIAKYAMPYDIEFRDDMPKTLVGKVAYRVLEEEELAKLAAQKQQQQLTPSSESPNVGVTSGTLNTVYFLITF